MLPWQKTFPNCMEKKSFENINIRTNFIRRKLSEITKNRKTSVGRVFTIIGIVFGAIFLTGILSVAILFLILSIGLPNVDEIKEGHFKESTTFYDKDGNVLYTAHGGENREYVSIENISQNLIDATIAIEDADFYEHHGFDIGGLIKAVLHETLGIGSRRGGSTITQQLAKNTFLTPEKSYIRKTKELILALRLENNFTKDEILEMYLNRIPYGNNSYGVEKAAETYFDKDAKDLDVWESAIIAALPNAPTYYSPYGQHIRTTLAVELTEEEVKERNIIDANGIFESEYDWGLLGSTVTLADGTNIYLKGRVDTVFSNMVEQNMIGDEAKQKAWEATQQEDIFEPYREKITHPHFVLHVKELIEKEYGKEMVEGSGLKVYTTLDPKLQDIAQSVVEEHADRVATNYNANNISLTAMNPKNGHVVAMIGSKDYFNDDIDGKVNMATSKKQPGSSFKPIVYAEMFKTKYGPGSVMYDVSTPFGSKYPKNYDGGFYGPTSIRVALGKSRNIPAIKAYYLAGEQEPIVKFAHDLGIESLNPEADYGWPLGLGSGEVQPIEMVEAYSVFANGGTHHEPVTILKIEDSKGEIIYEWKEEENKGEEVLDPQVAYLINDILSDRSSNVGDYMELSGITVAAKTGTSTKELPGGDILPSNLWTIGYTTNLVAGVWTGNTNDSKSGNLYYTASGYTGAAPIWNSFMAQAHADQTNEEFPVPEGIKRVGIDKATGLLPSESTPEDQIVTEIFPSFSVPTERSDAYKDVMVNTVSNKLWEEGCGEEFVENRVYREHHAIDQSYTTWENAVLAWAQSMAAKAAEESGEGEEGEESEGEESGTQFSLEVPPTEVCIKAREEQLPIINIISPEKDEVLDFGKIPVETSIYAPLEPYMVEYFLDDNLQYTAKIEPMNDGNLRIFRGDEKTHLVTVVLYDKEGYKAEATTTIFVGEEEEEEDEDGEDEKDKDEDEKDKDKDEKDKKEEEDEDLDPAPDEEDENPAPDPNKNPDEEPTEEPQEDPEQSDPPLE